MNIVRKKVIGWFILVDAPIVGICLMLALLFVDPQPITNILHYWWIAPIAIATRLLLFWVFRLYRWVWYYFGSKELIRLTEAVTLGSIAIAIIITIARVPAIPSVLVIDWMLNILLVGGFRFTLRVIKEDRAKQEQGYRKRKRTLLIGGGDAAEAVIKEIDRNPRLRYELIGCIDDDQSKIGQDIHEIPILGNSQYLPAIVKAYGVEEILIAIPSATGDEMRKIVEQCEKCQVSFRTLPGLYEFIDGSIDTKQIREVKIEDLLGREPHKLDLYVIASYLQGTTIMVTGAAGSIGSELCRQIAAFNPTSIVLFDHEESNIYDFEMELRYKFPELNIQLVIGNIQSEAEVNDVLSRYHPSTIFHAAAFKHVPLMEANPCKAVRNNITGSKILIDASDRYNVDRFVLISTDKAVNPTSVMGATKRVAEMLVQSKSQNSKTKFVAVRFGNVLGSRGSVVPLFNRQIARGGPVTVTDPETIRYFMTTSEAVQLILQAGSIGRGGEVFVLDMGKPVKILDLAKDMIRLSGLEEGKDIDIEFTGLRPGEKLYEELLTADELTDSTQYEKIYIARLDSVDLNGFKEKLQELEQLANNGRDEEIRVKLKDIVPAYIPRQNGAQESDTELEATNSVSAHS